MTPNTGIRSGMMFMCRADVGGDPPVGQTGELVKATYPGRRLLTNSGRIPIDSDHPARLSSSHGCPDLSQCFLAASYSTSRNKYCTNEADTLGLVTLAKLSISDPVACWQKCQETETCQVVQMECGKECWLLPSCSYETPSSCGSSILSPPPGAPCVHACVRACMCVRAHARV